MANYEGGKPEKTVEIAYVEIKSLSVENSDNSKTVALRVFAMEV
jgi:hypothetical protein